MRRYQVVGSVCLLLASCGPSETPATDGSDAEADSLVMDSTSPDTTSPDTTSPDTEMEVDSATLDTMAVDTTPSDTSSPDTSDTKPSDTSVADTAIADVADTAVADTAVADTALADTAVADTVVGDGGTAICGAPPYGSLDPLSALLVVTGGSTTPITISANICPATTVVVNPDEKKAMDVTKGVPFFLTGSQTGSLPSMTAEYNLPVALTSKLPSGVVMFHTGVPAALANPAWDPTTMAFFYTGKPGVKSGATAPCNTIDGITYTVTGHTEAVIKYEGGGTSTSTKGTAFATIVTTGTGTLPEYTTVTLSKTGCKFAPSFVSSILQTGRIPFARGYSSVIIEHEMSNL